MSAQVYLILYTEAIYPLSKNQPSGEMYIPYIGKFCSETFSCIVFCVIYISLLSILTKLNVLNALSEPVALLLQFPQ